MSKTIDLLVKCLVPDAVIPFKAHEDDAGFDLFATESFTIKSGETLVIPTGIAVQLPKNFEIQIRPRSGITSNTKLRVQLGTVDRGYRGELGIIIDNISQESKSYTINKGDKLAQFIVNELPIVNIIVVDELSDGDRGTNGFGSTGQNRGA